VRVRVLGRCLRRGEEHEHIQRPIDVVVASDVVYWEHLFAPLARTLNVRLTSYLPHVLVVVMVYIDTNSIADRRLRLQDICSAETVVYLSWQKRRKNDKQFFKMIGKHFTSQEVCLPSPPPTHPSTLANTHPLPLPRLFSHLYDL
jgi:hypothetical protein